MRLRRHSFLAMVVVLIPGMTIPKLSLQAQDNSIIVTLAVIVGTWESFEVHYD